jgi:hypothetical protein
MRSCVARPRAALALVAFVAAGCASGGREEPPPAVFDPRSAARPALPDDAERAAGRVAAFVLADRPDDAAEQVGRLAEDERARIARGEAPSGLVDDARDLVNTLGSERAYEQNARRLLAEDGLDPRLRRRLEHWLDSQPLAVAERRLREDRRRKLATFVNRIVEPISRLALGGVLVPIESGRAALASLLVARDMPEATPSERAALRSYEEFLARHPDAPQAEEVKDRVERYREKWRRQLRGEALRAAERALDSGRPDFALVHLDRADRLEGGDPEVARLRTRADAALAARDRQVARTLESANPLFLPLSAEGRADLAATSSAVMASPLARGAARAEAWSARERPGTFSDEIEFARTFAPLSRGDETRFFDAQAEIADADSAESNMARHAARVVLDPEQNPYAALQAARGHARREGALWVALGSYRDGPPRRNLWRPLEYLVGVPGLAVSILTSPLRLLQYPFVSSRFAGPVLHTGEQYVARWPRGEHAEEVHRELEDLYAARGVFSQALAHAQALPSPDPGRVAEYRERIAERGLSAADAQRALDVRLALYRMVITEYADTPSAAKAREKLRALVQDYTPQRIRVSRAFLIEHPALWAGDALALRKSLLDGAEGNGEIAEEGITLIGGTAVRVPFVSGEPLVERIPQERFARFVSLLELESYEQLLADARESPVPDPQRDAFFESARLGVADAPRPTAASEAVYLSSREKFGLVKRRDSILPVELVLQGGLEDLGFAAFPRVIAPPEAPDAFLYE